MAAVQLNSSNVNQGNVFPLTICVMEIKVFQFQTELKYSEKVFLTIIVNI